MPQRPLKAGDTVEIIKIGTGADGCFPRPTAKGMLNSRREILKVNANLSELRLIEDRRIDYGVRSPVKTNLQKSTRSVVTELDIRGKTGDEASMELQKFIDDAVLSGLNQITVIHGKGTGVLRSVVHEQMKRDKRIKSFASEVRRGRNRRDHCRACMTFCDGYENIFITSRDFF